MADRFMMFFPTDTRYNPEPHRYSQAEVAECFTAEQLRALDTDGVCQRPNGYWVDMTRAATDKMIEHRRVAK